MEELIALGIAPEGKEKKVEEGMMLDLEFMSTP